MWYWVELKYFDDRHNREEIALRGPCNSRMEAETEALKELASIPNATYDIHELNTRDRSKARGIINDKALGTGGVTLPDVIHRRYRTAVRR